MKGERRPFVYILASERNGRSTSAWPAISWKRLHEHRKGVTGGFTADFAVRRLVYFEVHETMPLAVAREKALKKWRRDWKKNLSERENPHWNDLAIELGSSRCRKSGSGVDLGTSPG